MSHARRKATAWNCKEFKRILRQVMILPVVACLLLAGILIWQINGSNRTVA